MVKTLPKASPGSLPPLVSPPVPVPAVPLAALLLALELLLEELELAALLLALAETDETTAPTAEPTLLTAPATALPTLLLEELELLAALLLALELPAEPLEALSLAQVVKSSSSQLAQSASLSLSIEPPSNDQSASFQLLSARYLKSSSFRM